MFRYGILLTDPANDFDKHANDFDKHLRIIALYRYEYKTSTVQQNVKIILAKDDHYNHIFNYRYQFTGISIRGTTRIKIAIGGHLYNGLNKSYKQCSNQERTDRGLKEPLSKDVEQFSNLAEVSFGLKTHRF